MIETLRKLIETMLVQHPFGQSFEVDLNLVFQRFNNTKCKFPWNGLCLFSVSHTYFLRNLISSWHRLHFMCFTMELGVQLRNSIGSGYIKTKYIKANSTCYRTLQQLAQLKLPWKKSQLRKQHHMRPFTVRECESKICSTLYSCSGYF